MNIETIKNIQSSILDKIIFEKNILFAEDFKKSSIMNLIKSPRMKHKEYRKILLDCIQIFSDYFQKAVMIRNTFCDETKYLDLSFKHLKEEFGHNWDLKKDRRNRESIWDPILDASSAWFSWKMLSLNHLEKTVIMHMVLETSANIFFKEANTVMKEYGETNYFQIHDESDESHADMGNSLITIQDHETLESILLIQKQGWDVLNTVCDRITYVVYMNCS